MQERVHRKSPLSLAKFLRLIVVGAVLSVAAFIATAFATLALVRRSCRT